MVGSAVRDRTDVPGSVEAVVPGIREAESAEALAGARRALRQQIARLEREIAAEVSAGARAALPRSAAPAGTGARLLGMAELEQVRDRLVEARSVLHDREALVDRNRDLLEAAAADPRAFRRVRLTLADVGEAGCGTFTVKPKLGILGRTLGWWRLKLSLGCPLAVASRRARRRARGASPRPRSPERPSSGSQDDAHEVPRVRPGGARITSRGDARPLPPWGRVPVTEVGILAGIVVAAVGLVTSSPRVVAGGILVVGAAAGELAFREHFAGYRSHTTLLAGLCGVVVLTALVLGLRALVPGLTIVVPLVVAAAVFVLAFVALRRAFRHRAGVAVRV